MSPLEEIEEKLQNIEEAKKIFRYELENAAMKLAIVAEENALGCEKFDHKQFDGPMEDCLSDGLFQIVRALETEAENLGNEEYAHDLKSDRSHYYNGVL